MRTIVFALAGLLVAPGTLLAKDLTAASTRNAQDNHQVVQPELDQTLTGSIKRAMSFKKDHFTTAPDRAATGSEKRELSGVEANPWIVPSFR